LLSGAGFDVLALDFRFSNNLCILSRKIH
jgi:hypothetical protein